MLENPAVLKTQNNYPLSYRSTPNDPRFAEQWNLEKVGISDIWQTSTGGRTYGGDEIVIGVLESGLDLDHEDLKDVRWRNEGEIPNNGLDDDNNGYVDDYQGVNLDQEGDLHMEDPEGHGTNVIGVMGARGNNQVGITGVNWDVKIMLVTSQDLSTDNAIKAYTYFAEMRKLYNSTNGAQGAFVVATNSSFGYEGLFEIDAPIFCDMFNVMGELGILSVGAADNNQFNTDFFGDIPAHCPSGSLIIVTSTDQEDRLATAAFGETTVDIGAPGQSILTTTGGNGYHTISGTSFATPMVCGAIALLYSHYSKAFYEQIVQDPARGLPYIKELIFDNVTRIETLKDRSVTGGRFNFRAINQALQLTYPKDETVAVTLTSSPNPVLNHATFDFQQSIANFQIEVFDVLGRRIHYNRITERMSTYEINLDQLPSGVYFVILRHQGRIHKSQIVKF